MRADDVRRVPVRAIARAPPAPALRRSARRIAARRIAALRAAATLPRPASKRIRAGVRHRWPRNPRPDRTHLPGSEIQPRQVAVLRTRIDGPGIIRVGASLKAVAAADDDPVAVAYPPAVGRARRTTFGPVVLRPSHTL